MSVIEPDAFHDISAVYGAWTATMLESDTKTLANQIATAVAISKARLENERNIEGWIDFRLEIESLRLRDFARFGANAHEIEAAIGSLEECAGRLKELPPEPITFESQPWELAKTITIERRGRGLPRDLAAVPLEYANRGVSYALHLLLVHADERRSLAELLHRAQWEKAHLFTDKEVIDLIGMLQFLARYNYIKLTCSRSLDKDDLICSLKEAGIKEGDLLMVHGALSPMGVVEGGADTVIDALLDAIGETGTLLMPTFTRSLLCGEKGPARRNGLVPFHPRKGKVSTGLIADTFRKRPNVIRSHHPSHSVAGVGPLAEECLRDHAPIDASTGASSPWAKLHELNGKIVFMGASLASCTFLHYLEDLSGADYLVSSICVVDDDQRGRHLVPIPRNVPGDRDFYRPQPEESKIFKHLFSKGFQLTTIPIGLSELKMIEAAQFYELGLAALKEDPRITLRDPSS